MHRNHFIYSYDFFTNWDLYNTYGVTERYVLRKAIDNKIYYVFNISLRSKKIYIYHSNIMLVAQFSTITIAFFITDVDIECFYLYCVNVE